MDDANVMVRDKVYEASRIDDMRRYEVEEKVKLRYGHPTNSDL